MLLLNALKCTRGIIYTVYQLAGNNSAACKGAINKKLNDCCKQKYQMWAAKQCKHSVKQKCLEGKQLEPAIQTMCVNVA